MSAVPQTADQNLAAQAELVPFGGEQYNRIVGFLYQEAA